MKHKKEKFHPNQAHLTGYQVQFSTDAVWPMDSCHLILTRGAIGGHPVLESFNALSDKQIGTKSGKETLSGGYQLNLD